MSDQETTQVTTTVYEQQPEQGQADSIVFLFHGLGSHGRDLISLAPHWKGAAPNAVFISPDAPYVCDIAPEGFPDCYQWFSLKDRDPQVVLQQVEQSFPMIEEFIENQRQRYGVPYSRIVLGGFSQGSMMSLYAGPRLKEKVAGILAYSGALVGGAGLAPEAQGIHRPPVHLIHGNADEVVQVAAYHDARDVLENADFTVSGHTTRGLAHGIDEQGIESGGAFLTQVLSK